MFTSSVACCDCLLSFLVIASQVLNAHSGLGSLAVQAWTEMELRAVTLYLAGVQDPGPSFPGLEIFAVEDKGTLSHSFGATTNLLHSAL